MLTNPLNLSPTAISRGAELFSRYQNQCRLNQLDQKNPESMPFDENGNSKNFLNIETKGRKSKLTDNRKIDKIAENLRSSSKDRILSSDHDNLSKIPLMPQNLSLPMPLDMKTVANFNVMPNRFGGMPLGNGDDLKSTKDCMSNLSAGSSSSINDVNVTADAATLKKSLTPSSTASCTMPTKQSNSKLYATCFICHKQLSNQYNLRVHLETHQNVRYANLSDINFIETHFSNMVLYFFVVAGTRVACVHMYHAVKMLYESMFLIDIQAHRVLVMNRNVNGHATQYR